MYNYKSYIHNKHGESERESEREIASEEKKSLADCLVYSTSRARYEKKEISQRQINPHSRQKLEGGGLKGKG